jgi:hypothetical protein
MTRMRSSALAVGLPAPLADRAATVYLADAIRWLGQELGDRMADLEAAIAAMEPKP